MTDASEVSEAERPGILRCLRMSLVLGPTGVEAGKAGKDRYRNSGKAPLAGLSFC